MTRRRLSYATRIAAQSILIVVSAARVAEAQSNVPAPGTCDTGRNRNADCRMFMTVSSTIQATRRLVVTPGSSFALAPASGSLTVADYDAGFFDARGSIGLTVQSNAPWRLTVQANAGIMSGSCSTKGSSEIRWGLNTAARATPLSTSVMTIASSGAFTALRSENVFLRVAIGWLTDAPVAEANCTLPMSFQITAP